MVTWDDDEGWYTHTVVYEGGPVFSQRCPSCGRFMPRDSFKCSINGLDEVKASAACGKCGEVDPVLLCWDGDCDG